MFRGKTAISTSLKFIIGRIFGFLNDKDIVTVDNCRDDYERSILYTEKYGGVIRFNKLSCRADTFIGAGGLAGIRTKKLMEDSVVYMTTTYPEYCVRKKPSKSRKFAEIRMFKSKRKLTR